MNNENLIPSISEKIDNILLCVSKEILNQINEIRIRKSRPLILVIDNNSFFINSKGRLLNKFTNEAYIVNSDEFDLIFRKLINYSMHSSIDSLTNGYIITDNGNRVGVSSTAIKQNNNILSVKDINSLNYRISREIDGCSLNILSELFVNEFPSVIVVSKPSGGKTTFLRDISKELSNGFNNCYKKVCIIDERNEIAHKNKGNILTDVGLNTDVLTNFPKDKGIEIAIRTLSPEIIVCDEISKKEEVMAIADGFSSGVKFVVSVHASSIEEIKNKTIIKELLSFNEFKYIVLLESYTNKYRIIKTEEL